MAVEELEVNDLEALIEMPVKGNDGHLSLVRQVHGVGGDILPE
jgi:hypothetical protein